MKVQVTPAPWGLRDVVLALVAAVALVLLVLGSAIAGLIALRQSFDSGSLARPLAIAAIIIYQLGFLGIALSFARGRGGTAALGFRPCSPRAFVAALGCLVLGLGIQVGYGLLLQALGLAQENPQRIDVLVGTTPASLAIALLSAALIAPIAEEAFFRGLVLQGLIGRLGAVGAVVVSSLLFALSHLVPQVIPPIFLLGILLALLRLWSGSLWPAILLHSLFNTLSLVAVYTASRSPSLS
ncbi:MAG: CPBP family intramembrane metalloprotease [Chloroflexi bacterium]|nr:CPBP family intramembrane metalloprotease [Chloroflexota bacterium]